MYTHILSGTLALTERRSLIRRIILFFCEECKFLKVRYWPTENVRQSLYGSDLLNKHKVKNSVGEDGILEIICCINKDIVDFFNDYEINESEGYALPFFHLELLDEHMDIQLYCSDFGSDILFDKTSFNSNHLFEIVSEDHFDKLHS